MIDGSPASEVLLGRPRTIRGDDWFVQLPLAISQRNHRPPFPRINRTVGLGIDTRLPIELPVADPSVLFHPGVWGFFLDADVGLAWLWWSRVLGLFAVWLLVFRAIARGGTGLAAIGASILVFSPFFQFWSFNAAANATSAGAVFLAARALMRAERRRELAAAALGLALSATWFALAVYPPYQITLAYLDLALVVGYFLDHRAHVADPALWRSRLTASIAATALAGLAVAAFAFHEREPIRMLAGTYYPGQRLVTSELQTVPHLLLANLGAPLWVQDWTPVRNICEMAGGWLAAPAPIVLEFWRGIRSRRWDWLGVAVCLYWLVIVVYMTTDVLHGLAQLTLLSRVPHQRAAIGLVLADAILVVRFLAAAPPARARERGLAITLGVAWALALWAASFPLRRELPEARPLTLLGFATLNGAIACALLCSHRRHLGAALLAVASFVTTIWFNPLVRGGTDWLTDNELSRRISKIDAETPGGSTWAVFGDARIANLFRILDVRSINGALVMPQVELWSRIDPRGGYRWVYNRYAHVSLEPSSDPNPTFVLGLPDAFRVSIDPSSQAFRDLGVTHVLNTDQLSDGAEAWAGFEYLGSVGRLSLFRVPSPPWRDQGAELAAPPPDRALIASSSARSCASRGPPSASPCSSAAAASAGRPRIR